MKNKIWKIIVGGLFILIGIGYIGEIFNFWDFNLWFDGWWTLFIIIPSLVAIFRGRIISGLIGVIVGALLFLATTDIITYRVIWQLVIPGALIFIGMTIISKGVFGRHYPNVNTIHNVGSLQECTTIFSAQQVDYSGKKFIGANITTIFGGTDLLLKNAIIDSDVVVEISVIFGGVEIFVPDNVNVVMSNVPIFGGGSNKAVTHLQEGAPTIYVNGTCIFGGFDIK